MTISKTQIFNIALNILGVSTPFENPNSSDNRAILLNNYYNLARDYVLKDFDWHLCLTMQVECELNPNAFPVNFSPSCQFDIIILYNIYEVKDIVIWVENLIVSLLFLI